MKKYRKEGFTLIELMIVISVIGTLSMLVVPKVLGVKKQVKVNTVQANVYIIRSYLENRASADKGSLITAVGISTDKTIIANAIKGIQKSIGDNMQEKFQGSNAITNPFNNKTVITYSQQNIQDNNPSGSSVVIGYKPDPDTDKLPTDVSAINTGMNELSAYPGDIAIIIYNTGYVIYGVDSDGSKIAPIILPFPKDVLTPVTSSTPSDDASGNLASNVNQVVAAIKTNVIYKIITGVPNGQIWNVMQGPLYQELYNRFTPKNNSTHIVNPFYLNADSVGDANGWLNPDVEYSIIADPYQGDYPQEETKYSNSPGSVVVYAISKPNASTSYGYVVYGVDKSGKMVDRTLINLSTEVTSVMTQTLTDNVTAVYNRLANYVDSNISQSPYGNQDKMSSLALQQLQGLTINNAYVPTWNGKMRTTSTNFNQGYGLVIGYNDNGAVFSDFKGSIVVNVLNDGSGYEIYGVDYTGNKYAAKTLTGINAAISSNINRIVPYLQSLASISGNNKFDPSDIQQLLVKQFQNTIVNPYNSEWNDIVEADDSSISGQNSVIVCDSKVNLDYSNYKGDIIVQMDNASGYVYKVFGIGYDGSLMPVTRVVVK